LRVMLWREWSEFIRRSTLIFVLLAGLSVSHAIPARAGMPERLRLPAGFGIGYFATAVPDARSLALGGKGTVFVGTRKSGRVYALVDRDGDGRAEQRYIIASGLNMPNGVAFFRGALYVAENHRIIRFRDIEQHLADPPRPEVVFRTLPHRRHHGWRYLAIGPDRRLYVSIGAPCNICNEPKPFATICRLRPDGSGFEVYAEGVRNSVGFTWHPDSGVMWFTDNGRDWLGDHAPPDELNRAEKQGLHFGYPFLHGRDIVDPEFGNQRQAGRHFTAPAAELDAHVAALGLRFYTGSMFPGRYRGQLFIAEHGSWNRSTPVGYRIIAVQIEDGKAVSREVFASGWLHDGRKWGRPVDLLVMPDGSLLVSDDLHGVVYRIRYQADDSRSTPADQARP
ncbi:MAG: PQQ-dependent sugar dehydrogenase, partial [Mariprofundaceae bacterium]|nr:PQQ-dependent sugar dehydrogenase [Mariprofundaceae bacterium]